MTEMTTSWSDAEKQAIQQHVSRLLASSTFTHAERLCRFLAYIVDETLAGHADRLNQYVIAMAVFDRDESFDPTVDAIVRVEAGRLRSKLREYYEEQGTQQPVRIRVSKRGYFANFQIDSAETNTPSYPDAQQNLDIQELVKPPIRVSTRAPTVAVLPFLNMSSDPEQDYFADGMVEDLTTDLARIPGFSVIARNSTFVYKGAAVNAQQICEELGAQFLIEGSLRKIGSRVRVNVQLIDGITGIHIWADRIDRNQNDIFELQDEITHKIVEAFQFPLPQDRPTSTNKGRTEVIDAYDYVLRGMKEAQSYTKEGSVRARYCFECALELDAHYAVALARLAIEYCYPWIGGWTDSREDSINKGHQLAQKAVNLNNKLALAHAALCWTLIWQGDYTSALQSGHTAIQLDPNDAVALERLAFVEAKTGQADRALQHLAKAHQLNPHEPYYFPRGLALYMQGRYSEAADLFQSSIERRNNFLPSFLHLASSYGHLGQFERTDELWKHIKRIHPRFNLTDQFRLTFHSTDDRERFLEGLRQAGIS